MPPASDPAADPTAGPGADLHAGGEARLDARAVAALEPVQVLVTAVGHPVGLPAPVDRVVPELVLPRRGDGRPAILANFVATLDGTVRLSRAAALSPLVALGSAHDWLLLGLWRAVAATIVVGAGVVREPGGRQGAEQALPDLADVLGPWRASLGLGPLHHVVVTAGGDLPADSPVWDGPATVLTTPAGARRLRLPAGVDVVIDRGSPRGRVGGSLVADVARDRTPGSSPAGVPGMVLAEPGPALFADLVATAALDEVALTVSPAFAGTAPGRLTLMDGPGYGVCDLAGLARVGSHLFTRWRLRAGGGDPGVLSS